MALYPIPLLCRGVVLIPLCKNLYNCRNAGASPLKFNEFSLPGCFKPDLRAGLKQFFYPK